MLASSLLPALLLAGQVFPPRARPSAGPPPLPTAIYLTIRTAAGEARAAAPPGKEPTSRPSASLIAGDRPQIRWSIRNTHPKNAIKNVVIHFVITKEDAAGSRIPPGPQQGTVVDTVFGTDIRAGDTSRGNYHMAIEDPGVYLVEVELLDPQGNRRNYCAVDLSVEQP